MEGVLDFSAPLDVHLLDSIVNTFYDTANPQRNAAHHVMVLFQEHPDAWTRVDTILDRSTSAYTRFFALQVLEQLIKYRWRALPREQREGVRTYVVQKIILLSSAEVTFRTEHVLITKLNALLVEILKHEWPANWPSFIPDIVAASKTSELLCENNVDILRLLSEEIFDFSKGKLTVAKAESLKTSLHGELAQIFELFQFILQVATRPSLINATLNALQKYVTWIPERFIFQSNLLDMCCNRFLGQPAFRLHTIGVLTEIANISHPEADALFQQLYIGVIAQIVRIIPPDADVRKLYAAAEASPDQSTVNFMRQLALFLCAFFRVHLSVIEGEPFRPLLVSGMNYLVAMSDVDDHEIFKICVEYWLRLSSDVYAEECAYNPASALNAGAAGVGNLQQQLGLLAMPGGAAQLAGAAPQPSPRKALYGEILARVREIMIDHMAKPEEVLIEEDDSGDIVRERNKNTEALELYKVMKDTLVYLTHLDPRNTEDIMLEKLQRQMDDANFNWDKLNTLCWAIGSISGAMTEADEKRFLVTVIKDLLTMCEHKRGKNNKAVVASNIMYVVGQYPRFLRAHWKFLKTVVIKLFEFMHERHPGVQDMAVETFLKITQKCKRKFVQLQPEERMIFVEELCGLLPSAIGDLQTHQVHTFYEAAGHMVAAHTDAGAREILTERLMALPNAIWVKLMTAAVNDISVLNNVEHLREIQRVLRTNVCACRSIGPSFAKQLGKLYLDMLNVYKAVSNLVSMAVATNGPGVTDTLVVRAMISVKKEVLNMVSTYVNRADDPKFVAAHFIPPLLDPVLTDYATSTPAARDPEVLVLMTEIVNKLRGDIMADVPKILEAVFESTLSMISSNFTDFPDHRVNFFKLLEAINMHCFAAIFAIPPAHQKLVVDSIVYAFKHTAPDMGELGLTVLAALLENVASMGPDISQPFYSSYFLSLIQDILAVLTDRLHKAQFKMHATVLRYMCHLVETGAVVTPLWDSPFAIATGVTALFRAKLESAAAMNGGAVPPALMTNQQFVREYIRIVVSRSFTNLSPAHVDTFIEGLFDVTRDIKLYKAHLRDFLIDVLQFGSDDTTGGDLFAEERTMAARNAVAAEEARRRAVPGLANPYDVLGDADDL